MHITSPRPSPRPIATLDANLCIGCAKCLRVCESGAIIGAPKKLHAVIADDCSGCGDCVPVCPVDCLELVECDRPWTEEDCERARQRHASRVTRASRRVASRSQTIQKEDADAAKRKAIIAAALEKARAMRQMR
jgi:electron transport complex protein RnfB